MALAHPVWVLLIAAVPGVTYGFEVFKNGPPVEAPVAIKVIGPDLQTLDRLAEEVETLMRQTPGTENVDNPLSEPKTDLFVNVDRGAGLLGVWMADVDRIAVASMTGHRIPLSVIGAFPALLLAGYTFSFTAFIGFTSLVGIVVNNATILVDYANQLVASGQSVRDAVQEASETRFAPIVLTTLTTVGGLLPLTLTNTDLWSPLGWVIIGGLLVSTFLTLLVVPVLYQLLTAEAEGAAT